MTPRYAKVYEFLHLKHALDYQETETDGSFITTYASICHMLRQDGCSKASAPPAYRWLVESHYETPFMTRLRNMVHKLHLQGQTIPAKALCYYLWPGGAIQKEDLGSFTQSKSHINLIAYMISSVGYTDGRSDLLEWTELLQETICVSHKLHSLFPYPTKGERQVFSPYMEERH